MNVTHENTKRKQQQSFFVFCCIIICTNLSMFGTSYAKKKSFLKNLYIIKRADTSKVENDIIYYASTSNIRR